MTSSNQPEPTDPRDRTAIAEAMPLSPTSLVGSYYVEVDPDGVVVGRGIVVARPDEGFYVIEPWSGYGQLVVSTADLRVGFRFFDDESAASSVEQILDRQASQAKKGEVRQ